MDYSLVIPAFNEEAHIATVLAAIRPLSAVAITVVNDGSSDGTATVVLQQRKLDSRIRLLQMPGNRGKAAAVVAGAEASPTDLIVLLDADLTKLRPDHIQALLEPVARGDADMSLAVFVRRFPPRDWAHWPSPMLSGQRALRWSLFRDTPQLASARYGIEVALNLHAQRRHYRVAHVPWRNVGHIGRTAKLHPLRGCVAILQMWGQIIHYWLKHPLIPRRVQAHSSGHTKAE